ncbi:glyceraldehyde-3-phosphate dehydrogenase (NADP+) [Thermosyntropha lipolytica DSM 11003]|uniref:Glyceraldehyde-3-phosphate dehydrogenase (NADP+) n=1 Tax=Thermosyntropha lipolytica DSM 11003 TaxID=1123382 RepID=A0A1M5N1A5_9FIRM|nr:aldehyde dehydrogenase family protein [Thermosyntropha lipolytica]SHG83338.1 glyceraldehyde-3-phosphate dehydrogenase (NADP+) [Thermosyntropha lipolytica DSM 11003]
MNTDKFYPELKDIPDKFRIKEFSLNRQYLVKGKLLTGDEGSEVYSPVKIKENGHIKQVKLGEYPRLNAEKAAFCLKAALDAYKGGTGAWASMKVEERIRCWADFLDRVRDLREDFALLAMWEIAKPYSACLDEFDRTMRYIEDTMATLWELDRESGRIISIENFMAQIRRTPLGVVLCMGPFNYPLNETFAMLVPALIMGNSVIVKPPRYGALCLSLFMPAFAQCFPEGVINFINGEGEEVVGPIIKSGEISVLGFIGSTQVARLIINQHPHPNRLRTILGLEAKNPALVLKDADLEKAAGECARGALEFNGQRCTALKHIWVEEDIAEPFLELLCARVEEMKCGMPWEEDVVITPLPEKNKIEWLGELVEDALQKGARIINRDGGKSFAQLYYPTILYPVTRDMKLYHVEQFGPVIPVSSFKDISELKEYLFTSDYGQQASIFSSRAESAIPLIDILVHQVSRVNLNSQCRRGPDELPFTGRKDSAEGTLSVYDALRAFSIRSLVVANENGRSLFFDCLKENTSNFLRI